MNEFLEYHVTGISRRGIRFKMTYTNGMHAMMINLYNGSVWGVKVDGTRKLLKRVYN